MNADNKSTDVIWIVALSTLLLILVFPFFFINIWSESFSRNQTIKWYLSKNEHKNPVRFPCRIPANNSESYCFEGELTQDSQEEMVLAFYRNKQIFSVQINGKPVYTKADNTVFGNYELITIGHLPKKSHIKILFHNRAPLVFGQIASIDCAPINSIFKTIIRKMSIEIVLGIIALLTGIISLLLSTVYYNTSEEIRAVKYIGMFMVTFASWFLIKTRFFHLCIGFPLLLYFIENFLLLLFPQFILKACRILTYPNILYQEYQGFNLVYIVYFILAAAFLTIKRYSFDSVASWSILYLLVFAVYIIIFGFFETRITSVFDKDRVTLHSILLKNLKTIILLSGCSFGCKLTSQKTYCFFILIAYIATISLLIELFNQIRALKRLKEEFAQSKVSLLLSQIKPHFVYNTLNSIRSLIRIEPKEADKLVYYFSRFLKANMNVLEKTTIPFNSELDHIKFYVNIEQTCFPKLKVFYQIEPSDFIIPSLSIQPLVENAIKHGVLKRVEGGTVYIRTYEDFASYYIEIVDDGVGFSTKQIQDKGIGLRNIERRLEYYCHATLYIDSKINFGTFVKVTIPKGKNNNMI